MACEYPSQHPDHVPNVGGRPGYTYTADSLATAVLLPTRRPSTHGVNPDRRFEFATAHMVRTTPTPYQPPSLPGKPPWMLERVVTPWHKAYAVETRRKDGSWTVLLASQPTRDRDSTVWSEAVQFRQEGEEPDGLVPEGAFGWTVEHCQPFPVEALYSFEPLTCKGMPL